MLVFRRIWSPLVALLLLLAPVRPAQAADQKAALDKIKADNQAAMSAYGASDFEEMKARLSNAVTLGNENGLGKSKVLAQTYVLLGVLQVDGYKDMDSGVRFFTRALAISPAAAIPQGMATKSVKAAFKRAEEEDTDGALEAEMPPIGRPGQKEAKREARRQEKEDDIDAEQQRAVSGAIAEKKRADDTAARKQAEAERKERDKLVEDLAQAKVAESQIAAEKEKLKQERLEKERLLADNKGRLSQLEKEKADRDKQLTDTKGKLALVEKDKADRDKQLADAKARIQQLEKDKAERDKWLAATKDSEAKERAAKEKAEKERSERDKQLADAKARIQQLEKDKAERDKWLAATKDSEAKERALKEKAEKTIQDLAARDKDRKDREDAERQEREKLAEGPAVPGHFGEPIHCTLPDEVPAGSDLYVHCVPQPKVAAKVISLYYRPSGAVVYNAVTMDKLKKGWYMAVIPGNKVSGKLLQYYVEARDGGQNLAASNGKPASPNIATVKPGTRATRH